MPCAVLTRREENYPDDSDFYAVVWDEAAQSLMRVDYATTRAWTYNNHAVIDASAEVQEKARAWMREWARERFRRYNERQAKAPAPGKRVRVAKGRKIPVGTEALVRWAGTTTYFRRPRRRVLLELPDGTKQFTAADNVEVLDWERYLKGPEYEEGYVQSMETEYHVPFSRCTIIM